MIKNITCATDLRCQDFDIQEYMNLIGCTPDRKPSLYDCNRIYDAENDYYNIKYVLKARFKNVFDDYSESTDYELLGLSLEFLKILVIRKDTHDFDLILENLRQDLHNPEALIALVMSYNPGKRLSYAIWEVLRK